VFVLATILMGLMIRMPRPGAREEETSTQIPRHSEVVVPGRTERTPTQVSQRLLHSRYHVVKLQQPEVLVPPGQLAAVMQFASAMNQGRIDGEQIVVAQRQSKQPLKIETIQIAPVSIPQLDDASDTENTGGY
jgi:hypothetical protein